MGYEVITEKVKCLECGDTIEYGRGDKKFCCDTCKNRYNNRRTRRSKAAKTRVISALEKNYSILNSLLKMNVTSLSIIELRQMGFKFDCVTSYQKVRRHDVFLCFDISFTIISTRVTSITKLSINLPSFSEEARGRRPVREKDPPEEQ